MTQNKSILNETKIMNCGMRCTVIEDNNYDNITVQFEDGTIKKNCSRGNFRKGNISNPTFGRGKTRSIKYSILGETRVMNNGMKCTVIEDNNSQDISVKFEDGTIRNNCSRSSFRRGNISNPSLGRGKANSIKYSILGETRVMNNGMKCTVIEYNNRNDIKVKFEDGYIKKTNKYDFHKGKVANPNYVKGSVLGQSAIMKCGMKCTVIEDNNSKDISVKFEDGTIVEHIRRDYFRVRTIANPSLGKNYTRLLNASIKGESKVMKSGMKCTVIEDLGKTKITVQFEDGTIKENCSRDSYFKGSIIHPLLGRGYAYSKKNSILGQTKLMKCGMKCTVIEDNSADDITVQFEDGTIVKHKIRHAFQHRGIMNPNLINISSMPQRLVFYFIKQYFSDAVQNYRPDWLKNEETNINMELDIWIPSKKIGIEYDGVVWHKEENPRSLKKAQLIQNRNEIEKVITILEKGAFVHKSPKHINIQLESTSDRKQSKTFLEEMEKAINNILIILGINKKIEITDDILDKLYCLDVVKVYSQNLIRGENDLETLRPDLAEEWDYEKNKFLPSDITCGSGKKVWWICSKCGYSWLRSIQGRARYGSGCPDCARNVQRKRVVNIESGKVYKSITAAAKELNIKRDNISYCCKGLRDTAGGYHWKFVK